MIPEERLSTSVVYAPYLYPDGLDISPLVDWEMGGVALQDPSEGLRVKVWKARLYIDVATAVGTVYLGADDVPEVELFQRTGITQISLAFDQNMQPFIAFEEDGQGWFWWFDTTMATHVFTQLPLGSVAPQCCLDDKLDETTALSDIILAYTRGGALYYRQQRDRYTVETELAASVAGTVLRVGMNQGRRLQFAVGIMESPELVPVYRVTTSGRRRKTVGGNTRKIVGGTYV